jgi:hypothetical protein
MGKQIARLFTRVRMADMRKRMLSFVLPVFMLLCQQGAAWHQISHLGIELASFVEPGQHTHDGSCESCLAFDHLATVAVADGTTLRLSSFGDVLAPAEPVPSFASPPPALRNRGPPVLL